MPNSLDTFAPIPSPNPDIPTTFSSVPRDIHRGQSAVLVRMSMIPAIAAALTLAAGCQEEPSLQEVRPFQDILFGNGVPLPESCQQTDYHCTPAGKDPDHESIRCQAGWSIEAIDLPPAASGDDPRRLLLHQYGLFLQGRNGDPSRTLFVNMPDADPLQTYSSHLQIYPPPLSDAEIQQMVVRSARLGPREETLILSVDDPFNKDTLPTQNVVVLDSEDECLQPGSGAVCEPLFVGETFDLGAFTADGRDQLIRFELDPTSLELRFSSGDMARTIDDFTPDTSLTMPVPDDFIDETTGAPRIGDLQMVAVSPSDALVSFRFVTRQWVTDSTALPDTGFLDRNVHLAVCHFDFANGDTHPPHCDLPNDPAYNGNLSLYYSMPFSTSGDMLVDLDFPIHSSGLDQVRLESGDLVLFTSDFPDCTTVFSDLRRPRVTQNMVDPDSTGSEEERRARQDEIYWRGCGPSFDDLQSGARIPANAGRMLLYSLDLDHAPDEPLIQGDPTQTLVGAANSETMNEVGFPLASSLGLEEKFPDLLTDTAQINHGFASAIAARGVDPPMFTTTVDDNGNLVLALNVSDTAHHRFFSDPVDMTHRASLIAPGSGNIATLSALPFSGVSYCSVGGDDPIGSITSLPANNGTVGMFQGVLSWGENDVVLSLSSAPLTISTYADGSYLCTGVRFDTTVTCDKDAIVDWMGF